MPKIVIPLNDTRIKALKPKDKRYSVADGNGLVLEVMTGGSKIWRYRYSLHGKQQPLVTIGEYPEIGLGDARRRAQGYAELVASGVSPATQAKKDRGALKVLNSVRDFANLWYDAEIASKSEAYRRTTRRQLDSDILPQIGTKALADVTAADVLTICDRIKGRGSPQAALSARNLIKRMYQWAISRQAATINPAEQLVARYIATPQSRTRVLQPAEIGTLLRAVYASDMARPSKLAVHLLAITIVRKSELIEAEWSELDLEGQIWRIPAERMKKDREHWVHLSRQAVEMFKELRTLSHSDHYVLPMRRGFVQKPMSKSALNQAMGALKLELPHFVIHDFRRTASTHLNEMGQSPDAIEKALAHEVKGVRGVYNRAEYAEERRRILQLWADFVDAQIASDNKVVIGRFGNAA